MTATACPTRSDLNRLATGNVSDEEAERLSGHLDACLSCQTLLTRLEQRAYGAVMELAGIGKADADGKEDAEFGSLLARLDSRTFPNCPIRGLSPQTPPIQLSGFSWQGLIASGGMGQVWRAWDDRLNRVVAIKMLHHASSKSLGRFLREMRVVAALDHPNIVRALHADEVDGVPYLVMECIAGANLAEVERTVAPLSVADACELVRQMALGVSHFHVVGQLIHRDIKPANAMLSVDGTVKLLDLGLAVFLERDEHSADLTSEGNVLGTLNYMSPEQLNNSRDVDQRTDIYALGATLYRLLAGEAPHSRAVSLLDRLQAAQCGDIAALQSLRPEVPDALAEVVHRALAARRDDRWPDANSLAAALAPFTHGADLRGLSQVVSRRQAEAETIEFARSPLSTIPAASPAAQVPPRQASRWKWILTAAIVVALVACVWRAKVARTRRNVASTLRRAEPSKFDPESKATSNHSSDVAPKGSSRRSVTATLEPPPLDDWLAGRKILTVALDGSAEFSSINSALRRLQPGQVVEILDRGPYTESLDILRPPPDTGLISRCDTVIDGVPDSLPRTVSKFMSLHRVHSTTGFRLHGLVFRSDDTRDTTVIDGWSVGGLVLERCLVKLNDPRAEVSGNDWFSVPLVRLFQLRQHSAETSPLPIVIRESAFATPVEVFLSDDASDLMITRNWFNRSIYNALNITSIPDHHGRHAIAIEGNLFDGTASGTGMSIEQDYSDREGQSLAVVNNTFLGFSRGWLHYKLLGQSDVIPGTASLRNHFHTPLGGIACTRMLAGFPLDNDLATAAAQTWRIADNSAHFQTKDSGVIQQPGGMKIWHTELLSLERTDRNYLRFPIDCPLWLADDYGARPWIGALPPGPAPVAGDWFTNLLNRWNAVPETIHHAPPP
jgi:serine/threonine protein kinase